MANPETPLPQVFETEAAQTFVEEGHGGTVEHAEPELLGLVPFQWVSLAMLVLILIAIFGAKVHKTIAGGLDAKIATIREQLDEARKLREEAEALRAEYAAKIANAEKDAASMIENAQVEADSIIAKAESDTAAMIARREKMAGEKIAAAERLAIDHLRARAADASTAAAAALIAEKHDAAADAALADKVISEL
ncbi:hypothetical protein GCM10009127_17180 [Alteraurantiacibacter aestuarii]|uniref:ATP synthase subunit b n=1 Tax=Alteraurantiacibacter aestuarii TaxID=650004 RepID=A0A844ZKN4_9SPHN|nr:hypothetical protein [Alteraurantiacibacter aestuarii]MXO87696.1 hypothetical protein [Alteraurantiacibacter aestuarii]